MHPLHLAAVLAAMTMPIASALPQGGPRTVPETTDYAHTSTLADVAAFLEAVKKLPHADRLKFETFGKTHEGRELPLVTASLPGDGKDRLRALVIANIHAGEVEGKEAVQVLLREIAIGEHEALLQKMTVTFLPVYNGDGNERIDRKNRPDQNGPDGVGVRPNAQGFDLNRDFVKAEATECRQLLALFNRLDPHLFMDLHTTDGSYHGYHLTYAPSLSPNVDAGIAVLSRELLEGVRGLMAQRHSLQVFDYGNFETRDWDGSGAPDSKGQRGWWTYDSRPRYGTNYFGLRNRIAVLSEAYSHCDFKSRIGSTRAFVLEVLGWAAQNSPRVRQACAQADQQLVAPSQPATFGFETAFAEPQRMAILVGDVDRVDLPDGLGQRLVRKDAVREETMPVVRSFRAQQHLALPEAWALPQATDRVKELLALHGVRSEVLAAGRQAKCEAFAVSNKRKPKRPFQGHQELELKGEWRSGERTLPAGTLLVTARQPLARLAAQLLEAQSEDGLSTWNFLEEQTGDEYPVLRVMEPLPQEPAKAAKAPEARPADVASVEAIVRAVYDVISGDAGQKRDWDRMRSLFHPDARLVPMAKRKDGMQAVFLKVEDYVTRAGPNLEKDGFHEQEVAHRVEQFGDIAQVFSSYESRHKQDDTEPFMRGINSFQLCRQDGRWWVLQILWEQEQDGGPIPAQYLK